MTQSNTRVEGIIPARLESSRLARKLLLDSTGKPLIQHTWEAANRSALLSRLVIATDSEEIVAATARFGAIAEMTGEHPSGTDRIAEVARREPDAADIIVNIQGDEPEIEPAHLDVLVQSMMDCPDAEMATLATPIRNAAALADPSCTKVVCRRDGRALYFSRSCIPFCRDGDLEALLQSESPWLLHIGIYAYRRDFLFEITQRPPSPLERLEKLEQLRALESGATIQVTVVDDHAPGIDTPEDYAAFVVRHSQRETA